MKHRAVSPRQLSFMHSILITTELIVAYSGSVLRLILCKNMQRSRASVIDVFRGVVVPEGGGALFRQIFLSRNGAPANIVYQRRNADTAAFRQISSGRGLVYNDLPKC